MRGGAMVVTSGSGPEDLGSNPSPAAKSYALRTDYF